MPRTGKRIRLYESYLDIIIAKAMVDATNLTDRDQKLYTNGYIDGLILARNLARKIHKRGRISQAEMRALEAATRIREVPRLRIR